MRNFRKKWEWNLFLRVCSSNCCNLRNFGSYRISMGKKCGRKSRIVRNIKHFVVIDVMMNLWRKRKLFRINITQNSHSYHLIDFLMTQQRFHLNFIIASQIDSTYLIPYVSWSSSALSSFWLAKIYFHLQTKSFLCCYWCFYNCSDCCRYSIDTDTRFRNFLMICLIHPSNDQNCNPPKCKL